MRRALHLFFLAMGSLSILVGAVGTYARWHGGPIGPIPGGALAGTFAAAQLDPDLLGQAPELELQVNPVAPRSVTTWVVVLDGHVFVPAAWADRKVWPQIALTDPRVVIRVGDQLFERTAQRVTDPALLRRLRAAVASKYGLEAGSDGEAGDDGTWFFQLAPPDTGGAPTEQAS